VSAVHLLASLTLKSAIEETLLRCTQTGRPTEAAGATECADAAHFGSAAPHMKPEALLPLLI
jgi:hypothetical protein